MAHVEVDLTTPKAKSWGRKDLSNGLKLCWGEPIRLRGIT